MTLYGTALFLHIIFAIVLVGATAWEHVAVALLRRSRTVDGVRAHVQYLATMNRAMMPIAVLVLVPALYLAFAGSWWGAGWPVISLILFASAGALAGAIVDPAVRRLQETVEAAPSGPATPEFLASLADRKLTLTTWVLAGIDVAIVALMTNKPGYVGAVTIGAIGVAVGTALGIRESRHTTAPAAPSPGAAPA
ncbi:MAG: DUF2269 domain-containing protein [Actinobacteria bacterium]|nr:DUF2269 domain-containing protein [Actinomycetota bacterium]